MSLAAEAENAAISGRKFSFSGIFPLVKTVSIKYSMWIQPNHGNPEKKVICQLFHILGTLVASEICRFPIYSTPREPDLR